MRYDKEKTVTRIAPTKALVDENTVTSLKRVAAYCRVSTDEEDQINSYEIQQRKYTDKILSEPGWKMVGIYADRGITGTSVANRDEFKKMIRHCKKGKIDMIITKSVSRFARNTLDTLTYTRSLRELGIDVFFEEQNIHSIDPSSDFMISLYGSLAQSESESISENVKWGKRQSAKEGKVPFNCKNFLGYRKNSDGKIEIVPEEAEIIRRIYKLFLDGKTSGDIAKILNDNNIRTKMGKRWCTKTVQNILENVKYKGDVLTNKTFRNSVTSKKIRENTGEVEQFYISKHHPAIIDDVTFARVHAELERRGALEKSYEKGRKTERGKYNSKNVFNGLLVCGVCGMPYRRNYWMTPDHTSRPVWRCVKRAEYGKRYCPNSPAIYEDILESALMRGISQTNISGNDLKERTKELLKCGIESSSEANKLKDLQDKLARLSQQFEVMLSKISIDEEFDEEAFRRVSKEKYDVENEISTIRNAEISEIQHEKLQQLFDIIDLYDGSKMEFDEAIVRKCVYKIVVIDKKTIEISFMDGHSIKTSVI